jgi:prepilin-type N-terminal cleavage/methylation domain-containing protein
MTVFHRNPAGFTLTEVIVVSVIIGILSAVSVPIYINYVDSANLNGAKSSAELVAAAITYNHNRGLGIEENDWDAIGIASPDDGTWNYTFPALGADEKILSTYKITVTGISGRMNGKVGYFTIRPSSDVMQWDEPE